MNHYFTITEHVLPGHGYCGSDVDDRGEGLVHPEHHVDGLLVVGWHHLALVQQTGEHRHGVGGAYGTS